MRLAFILVCVQIESGLALPIGGDAFFLDVYRCLEFAKAIENSANQVWVGRQYTYERKTGCECQPRFAPPKTKFWD
jgi:hypothetical protein